MARTVISARAWCETCDLKLDANNGEAVAAQHAKEHRHRTVVEVIHVNVFDHTTWPAHPAGDPS